MKLLSNALLFISASALLGDVLVINRNEHRFIIFEKTGDRQVIQKIECKGATSAFPSRDQCSADGVAISRIEFLANLNANFALPPGYSDDEALTRLTLQIESLDNEADSIEPFSKERAETIRERILQLIVTQRTLIRLYDLVISKMGVSQKSTIDPNSLIDPITDHSDEILLASFDPTWADEKGQVWRLASQGGDFFSQQRLCIPPYRSVVPEDLKEKTYLRLLAASRIGQKVEKTGGVIWTDSKVNVTVTPAVVGGGGIIATPTALEKSYQESSATLINLVTAQQIVPQDRRIMYSGSEYVQRPNRDLMNEFSFRNPALNQSYPILCVRPKA